MPLGVWFMGGVVVVAVDGSSGVEVCAAVLFVVAGVREGADVLGVVNCEFWPFEVMFGLLDLRFVPKPKFLNLELIKSVLFMLH